MPILSWCIISTLESVQTDLESEIPSKIYRKFNIFSFESLSHFLWQIKIQNQTRNFEKTHQNFNKIICKLLQLWHPIFYKSMREIAAILFLMKSPKCNEKMETLRNGILYTLCTNVTCIFSIPSYTHHTWGASNTVDSDQSNKRSQSFEGIFISRILTF